MPDRTIKITGILLAGGMSQRMGSEKGSLRIGRSLLYQYPLRVLEGFCDRILISTCKASLFEEKHPTVCDEVKGIGPLGGIYSCLKQSSTKLNLVLSYDMPMVNQSLFKLLISESKGFDMVLPVMHDNRPEPTCGIYGKGILGLMEEMISEEDFALHHLLRRGNSRIVRITEEMECWLPELFLNINNKEDLKRIPPDFGK